MNVQDVLTMAQRVYLGDSDGDVYTPTYLVPFYQVALEETIQALGLHSGLSAKRIAFAKIPSNVQTSLRGGVDWLPDYLELVSVDSRELIASQTITALTVPSVGTMAVTTGTAHGRSVGDVVEIGGASALRGSLGQFVVATVPGPTSLTLQGYTWGGTYVSGTATLLYGTGPFRSLFVGAGVPSANWASGIRLREGNVIEFEPWAGDREFRVIYYTTPSAPPLLTDEVMLQETIPYLAVRSAMLAAGANGADGKAQALRAECWGEDGTLDNPAGKLGMLLQHAVRIQQLQPGLRPAHWSRAELVARGQVWGAGFAGWGY